MYNRFYTLETGIISDVFNYRERERGKESEGDGLYFPSNEIMNASEKIMT